MFWPGRSEGIGRVTEALPLYAIFAHELEVAGVL